MTNSRKDVVDVIASVRSVSIFEQGCDVKLVESAGQLLSLQLMRFEKQ